MKELDASVRKALEQKRLIFTVTPGRSGTTYLTSVLKRVKGVDAFHEAHSLFSVIMRYAQEDPSLAKRFLIDTKLPQIARRERPIYAETSHVFCKGFFEPLIELGIVPDLVLLRRDHRKVASSIFLVGEIPGETLWYLSPDDPGVLPLPGWRDMHEYQRCFWYCLEIERRAQVYGDLAGERGARVVDIDLTELVTPQGLRRLLSELELPNLSTWNRIKKWIRAGVVNTKDEEKKRANRFEMLELLDLDVLETGVRERIQETRSQ